MHVLTRYRIDNGLSQTELAKMLGFSRSYICRVENDERRISARRLARVKARIGLSAEAIRPDLARIMRRDDEDHGSITPAQVRAIVRDALKQAR